LVAWAKAGTGGIAEIGFLPCELRPDGRVHPLALDSAASNRVVDYMEKCNRTQRLNGSIVASTVELGGLATLAIVPAKP
jgi:poly-gamma-glutamate synthesis protein (capsule biosynthesis protein)